MISKRSIWAGAISLAIAFSGCASDKDKKSTKTAADVQNASASDTSSDAKSYAIDDNLPKKKAVRTIYNLENIDAGAPQIESALKTANDGNTSSAISALQSVTSSNNKAFLGHYDLGVLYERQENYTSARKAYEDALRAEPKFTPALLQIVRMDIRNGNMNSALNTANQYISSQPDVFSHNYARIEVMIANKQYDETIALINALLKRDEANPKLRYYLAQVEFERKRYRLAEFIVGESLEIDPDDYEALFLRARIHDALSEEDVSLIPGIASTLDRVLELNPDHLEALWMRGVIYYEASNYDKAEKFFRHIIELNPSTVGAYINLANTLKTLDKGPEALKLLNKAKELAPNDGLVDFALGTLYLNIELIHLPDIKDMDRLKLARTMFENAQSHWTEKDDVALAKGYIRTTDDAIETLQAMLDAEALFGPSKDDDSGDSQQDNKSNESFTVD
ncbi:MAG: tetratricopeptide repeat protein [Proteobacteria bacterium]|nr:tetratricopeptide repeat protein [Pseudomonadota bacterium]